jgi:hypothetical protein
VEQSHDARSANVGEHQILDDRKNVVLEPALVVPDALPSAHPQGKPMETAVIVRGRLSDSRHIELDEAVSGIEGEVEVVLRPS